ncbi:MAG: MBL fold metallo-hydrolase [Eubacteriales bacterium]|nr:MBL fold metallo-hydrolase [Eubacteriales bacterium]
MNVKRFPIGEYVENCYMLTTEESSEAILIDPGDGVQKVIDFANSQQLDIKTVLITHGHFDHTNGLKDLKNAFDCTVYMNKLDLPLVTDAHLVDEDVKDGDNFKLGNYTIKAITTPGHSLGGVCYICDNMLFSGDTLFKGSIGRTDLLGGNYDVLINSIESKLFILPDEIEVFPGHGFSSTIGIEKRTNPFFI